MHKYNPAYYPSGKPLCLYESGQQVYYTYAENVVQKTVFFMDEKGRFTGESDVYQNDILRKQKRFFKGKNNKGTIQAFSASGKSALYESGNFSISLGGIAETIQLQNGTTIYQEHDKRTNALIFQKGFTKTKDGTFYRWEQPCENNIPDGAMHFGTYSFYEEYKDLLVQEFDNGCLIHEHTENSAYEEKESFWIDPSTGHCLQKIYNKKNDLMETFLFQDFKMSEHILFAKKLKEHPKDKPKITFMRKYAKNALTINDIIHKENLKHRYFPVEQIKIDAWDKNNNIVEATVLNFGKNSQFLKKKIITGTDEIFASYSMPNNISKIVRHDIK